MEEFAGTVCFDGKPADYRLLHRKKRGVQMIFQDCADAVNPRIGDAGQNLPCIGINHNTGCRRGIQGQLSRGDLQVLYLLTNEAVCIVCPIS